MAIKTHTAPAKANQSPPHFVGGIEVVKIVRTHIGIEGGGSLTFGESVDQIIDNALIEGEEIQSFTVEINPDHWNAMRAKHHDRKSPDWEYATAEA